MALDKSPMVLVTGSCGQIGSELVLELRRRYGSDRVVATDIVEPKATLLSTGPFEPLDVTHRESVRRAVDRRGIDTIYHLVAILSATGEEKPQEAWNVNVMGWHNVLEVAREKQVERVFCPSSIAAFGSDSPRDNTPQQTIMCPTTMYGVTKVAGELLGNYYHLRYGLDVRGIRYPGVISSETLPGGGTTDYAVEIFYQALEHGRFSCFLRENTVLPMIYMPDCIDAAIELMEADPSRVKHHTSYNLSAISFSPAELVAEIRKHIPEFTCEYKPDFRQQIADSWPRTIDDSVARQDWGWNPRYGLAAMVEDMLAKLGQRHAQGRLRATG